MGGSRSAAAAAALFVTLLVPGCVDTSCLRANLSATAVPPDAPSAGGLGTGAVEITVAEAGTGQPVAGAALRAYWAVGVESRQGTTIVLLPFVLIEEAPPQQSVLLVYTDLRTDAQGRATLHAPLGARVSIASLAPEHGEEFDHANAVAGAQANVTLYRSHLAASEADAWTDVGVTQAYVLGGTDTVEWHPSALPWDAQPDTNREYTRRMVGLDANLTWDSGLAARGDLGLGLGTDAQKILAYTNDHDDTLAMGAVSESTHLGLDELASLGGVADDVVYMGPTYETMASPLGLPYNLTLEGTFDAQVLRVRYCRPEYDSVVETMSAAEFQARSDAGSVKFEPATSPGEGHGLPGDPDGRETAQSSTNLPFVPRPLEDEVHAATGGDGGEGGGGGGHGSPAAGLWALAACLAVSALARRRLGP